MLIQLVALAISSSAVADARPIAVAADTIVVGHPALRGKSIRLGADTTEVFVERDGKRQLINTSIEQISKTADGILIVFISRARNGLSLDSVTINPTTFATIRHVEAFPGKNASFAFASGRITGKSTDSTGTKQIDAAVDPRRFDFSVVQQISAAIPQTPGSESVFLSYDVNGMKERSIVHRVVGPDRITWHGSEVATWKAVMDLGTHQVTRWIDTKTGRDLQWEINMPQMHMIGVTK